MGERSWIVITILSALFAFISWVLEKTNEAHGNIWGLFIFYVAITYVFLLMLMYHFKIQKYSKKVDIDCAGLKLTDNTAEERRNSYQQAIMFYTCFHIAMKLLRYSDGWFIPHGEWLIFVSDCIGYCVFVALYPWQLSKNFHIVLALPPYFDVDDLQFLKKSREGLAAERRRQHMLEEKREEEERKREEAIKAEDEAQFRSETRLKTPLDKIGIHLDDLAIM